MKILVANLGSTSLKYRLFEFEGYVYRVERIDGLLGIVAAQKAHCVAAADIYSGVDVHFLYLRKGAHYAPDFTKNSFICGMCGT